MKRFFILFIAICMFCVAMSGCSDRNLDDSDIHLEQQQNGNQTQTNTVTKTASEFEELLSQQPLTVVSTKYVVQDEKYKSLYPDILQALLRNNTQSDIQHAVIAFVAWDKNNLPLKLRGNIDFSDGDYVREVKYDNINLIPGATYGENNGYEIDEKLEIHTFKAIVVSYETFEGQTWENPYYDEFRTLYGNKKLSEDMNVEVALEDPKVPQSDTPNDSQNNGDTPQNGQNQLTTEALDTELSAQPMSIISSKYVVQDEKYKSLYPDLLQVILKNNTQEDIQHAIVAFVAWDKNNLPLKLKGSIDFTDGAYVKKVKYDNINMIAGSTYGENKGFEVDDKLGVATFKAIVVSYETFEGDKWENPYYEDFCNLYENKKLKTES